MVVGPPELSGPSELSERDEEWPVVSSADLHRDAWVMALRADRIQRPGHPEEEPFKRLVLEHPGAVIVLALDAEERVLCLRQYRHPARRRFVELPAGLCDGEGEEPLDVARRELIEETGYQADEWTHLTSTYSSPGISEEIMHVYLARGLSAVDRGGFVLEHEEADMDLFWAPFDDLLAGVLDARLSDAPLVIAILVAHARGLAGSNNEGVRR